MMKYLIFVALFFLLKISTGQTIDTVSFYSEAFKENRKIFIQKPQMFDYKSDSVKLPVIYLLDGQHEWFIDPLVSIINNLRFTHEIPNAIVVIIPHTNRNAECAIKSFGQPQALDQFITQEVEKQIDFLNPNDYRILIGHSFSASFALHSYLIHPNFYSAIIANSPLDRMEKLLDSLESNPSINKSKISISIGGIAKDKDFYHRRKYNQLKTKYKLFFESINTFEADLSTHNAVPIVSSPILLTKVFNNFSSRYFNVAKVDSNYALQAKPEALAVELRKIKKASILGDFYYPPEIAEINGIASRYLNSGYFEYAEKVFNLGKNLYPNYYDFYFNLYDLYIEKDQAKAKTNLLKGEQLLIKFEPDNEDKIELLNLIKEEKRNNNWK